MNLIFIDRFCYTGSIKTLSTNQFIADKRRQQGIEILEAWMLTIQEHNNAGCWYRTAEGSILQSRKDRIAQPSAVEKSTNHSEYLSS